MYHLIAMALAGTLGLTMLTQVLPQTAELNSQSRANYAAAQLYTFTQAAENYVDGNYSSLVTATASGVQAVTTPMMITEGSLDASFVDTNTFNQTHRLLIRQSSPGVLQALVATCGGNAIRPNELARLSQLAGPDAGLISPLDTNNALGAGGHWTMALSNYTHASCALTPGHMTALITSDSSNDVSPYLHRNAHSNTDANTMFTDLLMDGNNVVNAGNLDVNTINNADGNVRVNDTLEVTGEVFNPSANLRINDALEVTGAISNPTGHVTFNDSVDLQSDLHVNRIFDRNNNGYYVDPASVSNLNDLRATIFRDSNNTGFYVDPASVSNLNEVRATFLRDRDNHGYYVDPASTSNTNLMNAQRLYSHGDTYSRTFRPVQLYTENSGCSQTNAVAVSTLGNVVTCKGGLWTKAGGQRLTAALHSVPVNSNYTVSSDGFVYVQSNTGCTYSYQSILINGGLRGALKAYAPGGSLSYGTFPVRSGDTVLVQNTFGCNPSFIYFQPYG